MQWVLDVFAVVVGGGSALLAARSYRNYRRRSPSAAAGYDPKNLSPLMRLWRQKRADAGKQDNWLTRPLLKINVPGSYPPPAQSRNDGTADE